MTPPEQATIADTRAVPELPASAALVALVPAIDDVDRAAEAAWDFARRVANAGRRVALIDCYVDAPRLHAVVGEPDGDGIVDVFEYGASLSRIARAQPESRLFFVPAGTFSPDRARMMASPRWRRLSAGFRHEGAVMLLFLPPDCIGAVATALDGLVALAPGYAGHALAGGPEMQAALALGVPLLATYTGGADATPAISSAPSPGAEVRGAVGAETGSLAPEPPQDAEPAAPVDRPVLRRPGGTRPRRRLGLIALPIVLVAAVAVVAFRRQLGWEKGAAPEPPEPPLSVAPAYRRLVPHAVDSLPFAVQVAAWTRFTQALVDADTIEGRGFLPMISPVAIKRTVWYRVYVGPVSTQDAADSVLRVVRRAGLDGSNTAKVALVPLSLALRRVATPLAARIERSRLREAGVAAFVLGQADGSYRLYAGAFESPGQAAYLDSLLTSTGSAGPLGPRVGFRP
jgi:hypothetical protein